ncbi:PTS sugar transporter subunit IIB [Caproiciproducens sp. MSJ-32]|uniref:PTS sugar transporter subunit IIB n=1 Tax=Caproiciproducens sp. MSJ-32 TaxID=2841527 RepID=UPI001C101541|nr:PTS sugar transporter subunit IIB [Caproiciproducens sp. MSJ-32]MBU5454746.1 PTS sugar transporter subunit IIB [Caproiciproducens sp. MSJ-32]
MKIITVCGNGIGSSLMLAMKIQEICEEQGIKVQVESSDLAAATGKECDLFVTVKELAAHFPKEKTLIVRSYINKKKITEDVLEAIRTKSIELN